MYKRPKILSLVLLLFYVVACTRSTPNSGNLKVRIINDDGTGHYGFQTVELKGVRDLQAMEGSSTRIYFGGTWHCLVSDCSRYENGISGGYVPRAKFVDMGDYLVPADYRSLVMSTVLYHFQNIKDFYDDFKANQGLIMPNIVNLDVRVLVPFNDKTYEVVNNAFYSNRLDSFFLIPFEMDNSVPLSLNGGVLAHEYFHRIFFNRVKVRLDRKLGVKKFTRVAAYYHNERPLVDSEEGTNPLPGEKRDPDVELLGSFDEGLADYFAYAYTQNPDFMKPSFLDMPVVGDRNVALPKSLDVSELEMDVNTQFKTGIVTNIKLEHHNLGSHLAHFLFLVSREVGIPQTNQIILNGMDNLVSKYADEKTKLKFKDILGALIEKVPPNVTLCKSAKQIFQSFISDASAPCLVLKNSESSLAKNTEVKP